MSALREVLKQYYAKSNYSCILATIIKSNAPEIEKNQAILDLHGTISYSIYFSNMTELEPLERKIASTSIYKQATKR
jgi:hypothetical protein